MLDLEEQVDGVVLPIRAHAAARRNAILGARAGALRVAVTAAPEKGKANQAIVALLSKTLGIAKSSIELVAGETSPQKRVLLRGVEVQQVQTVLEQLLRGGGT